MGKSIDPWMTGYEGGARGASWFWYSMVRKLLISYSVLSPAHPTPRITCSVEGQSVFHRLCHHINPKERAFSMSHPHQGPAPLSSAGRPRSGKNILFSPHVQPTASVWQKSHSVQPTRFGLAKTFYPAPHASFWLGLRSNGVQVDMPLSLTCSGLLTLPPATTALARPHPFFYSPEMGCPIL